MKIIGITGGIGSGKSVVLHIMQRDYNAYIVETDKLAHTLMEPGQDAYNKIMQTFGTDIRMPSGPIDRAKLGNIVFSDPEALTALNAIVHPAVKQYIRQDIEEKKKQGKVAFYVIEAALLIEDGYREICDSLWYIYTEKDIRIRRLLEGRGKTREHWESVIRNQSPDEFYKAHCDSVIFNGKSVENTETQLKELLCSQVDCATI